jgi:hypothetical protein
MSTQRRQLLDYFPAFGVVRKAVVGTGHVADIDGDVPLEGWTTLGATDFGVRDRLGQTSSAEAFVGADVGVAKSPQPQRS